MRLGQLARKLDIEPKEIVKFLEKQDITIENHLNTKLDDNQIELVNVRFTPKVEIIEEQKVTDIAPETYVEIVPEKEEFEEIIEKETISETEVAEETEDTEEELTVEIYEIPEEEFINNTTPQVENSIERFTVSELLEKESVTEGAEPINRNLQELSREDKVPEDITAPTITAPKIELKGIKVLGKIDLPQKETKEVVKKEETTNVENTNESSEVTEELIISNETGPKVHPNKIAKLKEAKKQFIADEDLPQEEKVVKPKKAKEIKLEKKAKASTQKKKKHQPKEAPLSPEAQARLKIREKRKRQRQNTKEAAAKKEKHWLKRIWDAIK